jgi:two-component system KDP operon response regulator KdpE
MTDAGPLVMIVEDEPQMRRFLRASLTSHGFRLVEAASAQEALALATSQSPEVILLDLGLPDRDGIELAREIRGWSRVPIIVISARGREADKVEALDAGADDYLTKPFGLNELLARIRVSLRRAGGMTGAAAPVIEIGPLCIDLARREVAIGRRQLHLTPIEYRLLTLLAQNAGRVLTQRQILEEVWGRTHAAQSHYVRVYMAQLRRKIESDPARPRLLVTEPGVGYRLRDRLDGGAEP